MKISEINIYPIKSLGGISLTSSVVERRGLQYDRRCMLVDPKGMFVTQREIPQLATISVDATETGLKVSAAGVESVSVPFQIEGEAIKVQVWESECLAISHSRIINGWFSEILKFDCKLVFMPDESERKVNPKFNINSDIVSFADGYPILVIGKSSLEDLNDKLESRIPMNRFRPNLVVSGSTAYAEDGWKKLRIGETILRITKPCARCVVTTTDQLSGTVRGTEPLKTLSKYRMARDVFPTTFDEYGLSATSVLFGQNVVPETFGKAIKVHDKVALF